MTSPRQESLDRILVSIPRVLQAASLDASMTEGLELLRHGAAADAAVLFLADGDAPLREYWAHEDPAIKGVFRPRLKVEALEAIRRGGYHMEPTEGDPRG